MSKEKVIDENNVEEKDITDENTKIVDESKAELLEIESRIDLKITELNEKLEKFSKLQSEIESSVSSIKLPDLTEKELIDNSLKIKEQLDKMPKKHVRIPIDEKNKKDMFVPVTISGYTYQIQRGESVEVPEEVERILIEAKYI